MAAAAARVESLVVCCGLNTICVYQIRCCCCIGSAVVVVSKAERDARTGCTQGRDQDDGGEGEPKHAPQAWCRIPRQQERRCDGYGEQSAERHSILSCCISFIRIAGVLSPPPPPPLTFEQTTLVRPLPFNEVWSGSPRGSAVTRWSQGAPSCHRMLWPRSMHSVSAIQATACSPRCPLQAFETRRGPRAGGSVAKRPARPSMPCVNVSAPQQQ